MGSGSAKNLELKARNRLHLSSITKAQWININYNRRISQSHNLSRKTFLLELFSIFPIT
jgi:hypothetical protein